MLNLWWFEVPLPTYRCTGCWFRCWASNLTSIFKIQGSVPGLSYVIDSKPSSLWSSGATFSNQRRIALVSFNCNHHCFSKNTNKENVCYVCKKNRNCALFKTKLNIRTFYILIWPNFYESSWLKYVQNWL